MTSTYLTETQAETQAEVNTSYRIVFDKRPNGFINGAIYTVIDLYNGYVKLKGYKLTFLQKSLKFYPTN